MEKFEFNEQNMIDLIAKNQVCFCTSYDILVPNCYTQYDNEADLFAIRKSGLCDEFEIKISRADFFNDAKKVVKFREIQEYNPKALSDDHKWLYDNPNFYNSKKSGLVAPWQKLKYEALPNGDMSTNYFWYVIKKGEVELHEIPEFAGVIFIDETGDFHRMRQPKKLHNSKISAEDKYKCARKLAYRFWDYRFGAR